MNEYINISDSAIAQSLEYLDEQLEILSKNYQSPINYGSIHYTPIFGNNDTYENYKYSEKPKKSHNHPLTNIFK